MTISVFIGTSVDGFIARPNGDLDFLPPDGGEPHGYNEFIAGIDALVIGRKTFETVLAFPNWPYGNKRVVVLSSHPSTCRQQREPWSSRCPALRRRSLQNWRRPAPIICTSMEALLFNDFCAPGLSSGSSLLECLCSLGKGYPCSASFRTTFNCGT